MCFQLNCIKFFLGLKSKTSQIAKKIALVVCSMLKKTFRQEVIRVIRLYLGFIYAFRQLFQNSPLWKRVIAWERSRAASGYGIIWGDADRDKEEEFSAECHSVDYF